MPAPLIAALIPLIAKYGIPAVAYGVGHLVGWFHHKKVASKTAAQPAAQVKP